MKRFSLAILVIAEASGAFEAQHVINNGLGYLSHTVDDGVKDWAIIKNPDGTVPLPKEIDLLRPFAGSRFSDTTDPMDFVRCYLVDTEHGGLIAEHSRLLYLTSSDAALEIDDDAQLNEMRSDMDYDMNVAQYRLLAVEKRMFQLAIETYLRTEHRAIGVPDENVEVVEGIDYSKMFLHSELGKLVAEHDRPTTSWHVSVAPAKYGNGYALKIMEEKGVSLETIERLAYDDVQDAMSDINNLFATTIKITHNK